MEESTDGNLDLLSAALNQSGLMGFDLPDAKGNSEQTNDELTLGLHNDPLLNALNTVSPGLLLSQKSLDNNQNYHNDELKLSNNVAAADEKPKKLPTIISTPAETSLTNTIQTQAVVNSPTVTKIPTIINTPSGMSKPTIVSTPTTVRTISGSTKPSGVKPMVIGRPVGAKISAPPNGAKIIKIPFLKAGSVIKINKLGKTGVVKPISLEELKNKSLANKVVETKAPTSTSFLMNTTKASVSSPEIKTTPNNIVSQPHSVNTTTRSEPKVFKKVTVRGKSVYVPMSKNDELLRKLATIKSTELKQSISVSNGKTSISYRVSLQNSTSTPSSPVSLINSGMSINVGSPTARDTTVLKPSPKTTSLNLGSLFVETVEKAVESDFETPPGSPFSIVLPQQDDQIVGKIVPSPLNISTNLTSSIINSSQCYSAKIKSLNDSNKQNHTFTAENFLRMKSQTILDLAREKNHSGNNIFFEKQSYFGKDATMRSLSVPMMKMRTNENVVEEEEREEESTMHHAQTYAEYMPSKLSFGLSHPDSVVETSSLASIMPPDVRYDISIPQQTIDQAKLSALQLESIVYACQKHETFLPGGERAGYLIGDGAGVGKGRTIAGVIYENYLKGRKRALWFSVSNDLKYDAERDLRDIGAKHIKVYPLNKFQYGKISSKNNGAVKKGVIFVTYSSLIGESHSQAKYHTRLKQLLHWCGENFDGPVILDECHKAKNLVPSASGKSTKTGATVLKLQNQLPNARVVYASATGASEPRHMAYMSRLGLWGPGTSFPDFMDFIQAVDRRGVGAMELVAMDMKLRGSYIARQLSFYGVSFRIEEVSLENKFIDMYNKSVRLWVIAREAFQAAASMIDAEHHMKKTMWGQFWSAHQRFFKYLCISAKVNHTVALVREAVKHGKCCVIGLQSTGEARTVDQLEKAGGELDDFVSTAKAVFENLIERHFPAPDRRRVTELFGKDFYNRNKEKPQEKKKINKRKRISNGKTRPNLKKQRRDSLSSNNDDCASSTSESANEATAENDELSSEESDNEYSDYESDSACTSDEDIGKLFGNGSDSEDCESPQKTKPVKKKRKKNKEIIKADSNPPSIDKGLNLEDLQNMNKKEIEMERKTQSIGLLESLDSVSGTLTGALPGSGPVERAQALKSELLDRLETLGNYLPNNMLDELIDALGGPENVAEMTGRKGRIVSKDDGSVEYQTRAETDIPVELLNLTEKQRFMDGEKNIAIISEAASSGISLQSDKRARNRRRRVHITLELPWSADRAIQQFGRTHRSNQVNAPEYVFMISELAGEQRFASVVAKRLESLGALTHGDRRASESRDLSKYNYDNKYGRKALESIMKSIAGYDAPLVPPPSEYPGHFFKDMRQALLGVGMITRETGQLNYILEKATLQHLCLPKHGCKLAGHYYQFMNRMLGMEVNHQNGLFVFFADTLKAIIQESKRLGQYDQGIVDLGTGSNSVEKVKSREFPILSCGHVSLHTVRIERGTDWTEAKRIFDQCSVGEHSGFYTSFQTRNDRQMVMLAIQSTNRTSKNRAHTFVVYRPNTGKQVRRETLTEIEKKYKSVAPAEAEQGWSQQYDASFDQCSHQFWQGACSRGRMGTCHVGMRRRTYHVLGGSVLGVWKIVEHVLSMEGGNKYKMQVVRLQTSDGGKLVGLLIPSLCVMSLINALTAEASSASLQQTHNSDVTSHVRHQLDDVMMSDESDEYEEVDDFEPDEMLSGVLVPRQQYY